MAESEAEKDRPPAAPYRATGQPGFRDGRWHREEHAYRGEIAWGFILIGAALIGLAWWLG